MTEASKSGPSGAGTAPRNPLLPPYSVRHDFLDAALVADLLAYAAAREADFRPARVGSGSNKIVDPAKRISSRLDDFEPLQSAFARLVLPLGPVLAAALKVTPFETKRLELQLIAHGDGAFFREHLDVPRPGAGAAKPTLRVLSGVYYFHAQPKGFEGGALRLLEIGNRSDTRGFIDIEPVHNSLVFFPSWMPHEVRKVHCPSRRFMASRFAINCWFHKAV